jgi:hypothetical protein
VLYIYMENYPYEDNLSSLKCTIDSNVLGVNQT